MSTTFENAVVGDRVWSILSKYGKIISISKNTVYEYKWVVVTDTWESYVYGYVTDEEASIKIQEMKTKHPNYIAIRLEETKRIKQSINQRKQNDNNI